MGYIYSIVDMKGKSYRFLELSCDKPMWSDGGFRCKSSRAHVAFCEQAPVEEILGVGISPVDGRWTFVEHTKKTANLHKYISVMETLNFDKIANYKIIAFGGNCSVVLVEDGMFRTICTVYDLLVHMCRVTGSNLLNKSTVSFGSDSRGWVLSINLSHTDAANRFYTKMWLDVVGNYQCHLERYR